MWRFPLFPTKMLKARPVALWIKHMVQADNAASKSYRKGTCSSKVGFLAAGTMAKPLFGGF